MVSGFGFQISGFGYRGSGFGFLVQELGVHHPAGGMATPMSTGASSPDLRPRNVI